jgi:hypothetical protein
MTSVTSNSLFNGLLRTRARNCYFSVQPLFALDDCDPTSCWTSPCKAVFQPLSSHPSDVTFIMHFNRVPPLGELTIPKISGLSPSSRRHFKYHKSTHYSKSV